MKILLALLTVLFFSVLSSAQSAPSNGVLTVSETSSVDHMAGPRFGFTYVSEGSTAQYLNRVHQMDSLEYLESGALPFTYTTQYGWQWETRFADTGGPVVGLVEWVALIGGMEKGMFLPSFSSLVGIRSESGFEFATGPSLSASGLSFIFALGYNYKKGDLNLPINIALVPDKQGPRNSLMSDLLNADDHFDQVRLSNTGFRLNVSVGFNLQKSDS